MGSRWLRLRRILFNTGGGESHGEAGEPPVVEENSAAETETREESVGEGREEYIVGPSEARDVLLEALSFYEEMPPVLRAENASKILFVGDTHGALDVSMEALRIAEEENVDLVVFIGDYVDRGEKCVENLHYLLKKQLESPEKIILLRGNHESPMTNYYYGFYSEVLDKLGSEFYDYYRELFRNMPYILLAKNWLVVHGGIPCRECKNSREKAYTLEEIEDILSKLKGREENEAPDDPVALQLLWNDPRGTIDWFLPSARGPGIYYYGVKAWEEFLDENNLYGIIRAHEATDAIYVWLPTGEMLEPREPINVNDLYHSVITVFSSRYHGMGTGLLLLDGDTMKPILV